VSRKITETDVRQAWHDALVGNQPVIERGGATVPELMRACGLSEMTARRQLRRLCEQCLARQIGVRPDRNRSAVYELAGPRVKE
jgi:DNA-binding Lrp family transcriptional regulator